MTAEPGRELRLHSPVGGEPLVFKWPLAETKKYSGSAEILATIRMVMSQYQELKTVINNFVKLDEIDVRDYDSMKSLCEKFSKAAGTISGLWKGATKPGGENWSAERADQALLRRIITQSYNSAVTDVQLLNKHYEAFSSETYGETSFDRLQMIIDELKPKDRDIFVDLGSGVGQLVVQMAGGSKVKKAVGIEIASVPALYAGTLEKEFTRWMKWYGKKFRPFELHRDNFLDKKFRDLITKEATIVFINNYAFTADLEAAIKRDLLSEMKDGTRIVSTKPYGNPSRPITDRQMSDISAIMDVSELKPCQEPCSWTNKYVPYYLHVINRAKLEKYFFDQRFPALRAEGSSSRRSSSSSKNSSSHRESSRESSVSNSREQSVAKQVASAAHQAISRANSQDDGDDVAFGPTTRRKWNDYLSQLERNKKQNQRTKEKPAPVAAADSSESPVDSDPDGAPMRGRKPGRPPKNGAKEGGKSPKPRGRPGRPRKSEADRARRKYIRIRQQNSGARPRSAAAVNLPDKVRAGIDLLHDLTLKNNAAHPEPVAESSSSRLQAFRVSNLPKTAPESFDGEASSANKYPGLDALMALMRRQYEVLLDDMQTVEFRQSVLSAIEAEQTRKASLKQRVDFLEKQVQHLQQDGVRLLKQRLTELNIEAETPAELLNQSKEIVLRHKDLQAQTMQLEKETAALTEYNYRLVAMCHDRDEQLLHSGALQALGFSEHMTVEAAKEVILRDIGLNFDRHRALLGEVARMQAEVTALESAIPSTTSADVSAVAASHPPSVPASTAQSLPPTTTAAAPPTKRPRQRSPRASTGTARKKAAVGPTASSRASVKSSDSSDPKRQEEIERQIQDIVQKALSVDSAAKSAEKERKAKSAERKRSSKVVNVPTTTAAALTASVDDVASGAAMSQHQALPPSQPPVCAQDANAASLTFASAGLVPVYAPTGASDDMNDRREEASGVGSGDAMEDSARDQRPHSVSSTETESAHSDDAADGEGQTTTTTTTITTTTTTSTRPSSVPTAVATSQPGVSAFRIDSIINRDGTDSDQPPRVRSACPNV